MYMGLRCLSATIAIALASCASGPSASGIGFNDPLLLNAPAGARMIFDDEFNGASLDTKTWYTCYPSARPGAGCTNNPGLELEWYEPANVTVANGYLSLTAIAKPVNDHPYTSGMISTGGKPSAHSTFAYLYGYAESRIKLPRGAGMWPAFWLIPANRTWPPEIDIMEWQGVTPTDDIVTIHWGTAKHPQQDSTSVNTRVHLWSDYHTYGLDWEPSSVVWYFDGKPIKRYTNNANIPHQPMFVILNLAIGGWLPGQLKPSPSSF